MGKHAKQYFGGIIGASPLDSSAPRTSGVFSLGALGGDGASATRPTRRWGGMTGRSLVASDNVRTTGVLSLPELLQATYGVVAEPGTITFATTATTSSHSETHTADATWSTSGDIIIHDGWNQQNTDEDDTSALANHGTFTVADGDVTVDVEVWGAAGGSGRGGFAGYGGGGEYRKARMVLKPGTYYWMVGGGGGVGNGGTNRQGSGGWGGGGSSGGYSGAGNDATAFGNGGDISTIANSRNALGAGGGGLTGIFGATSASQADALLVAGGGGGYGYLGRAGKAGGTTNAWSGSDTSGGSSYDNGGAGKGGHGATRGGGGGGGYWGGAGGQDGPGFGGGGRGYTVASDGHALVGTVSDEITEAGSGNASGGSTSSNYITDLAKSNGTTSRAGRGGRLVVTIV